ncbi:16S rRNA (adenine(1518)-N(6)/adenine(1519)-N(6))-dimethyltransferase RsmA [Candidatus Bipolaricaulota sp. J31]
MNLTSPSAIREILSRHGIRLKKGLGQHFLADGNVLHKILTAIDPREDEVAVEVGAGIGTLTCALAPRVRRLYAVEIDRRLVSILREHCAPFPNVEVVHGDFLKLPLESFDSGLLVVGNLPYAITSEVLLKLVREKEHVNRGVFLIQWEVARKLAAPPGPERSRLGVHLSAYYGLEVLFRVPRGAFFPPPEVDGGLVRLERLPEPRISTPEGAFEEALRVLFSARRKTLRRVLASRFGDAVAAAIIAELGLDPRTRAESLPLEELDRIAAWLRSRGLLAAQ